MLDKGIKIIKFSPQYTDEVIKLIDASLKRMGIIPKSNELIDDEDLFKIPQVYKEKGRFWIALRNKHVIGIVAIQDLGNNKAKLNRMFVEYKYHGGGLGQKLLDVAINFAKNEEFKELILNTYLTMKRAHNFYNKNGFKRIGEDKENYHYKLEL